ncbi:hypothetical protein QQF64_010375 [Cirrhinus molitorella]|uniref:Uncharacterized protein n=1 Tax=Cirrhinus molitorella TaxID=172907 RepID=A0ABR3M3W3_9TELE
MFTRLLSLWVTGALLLALNWGTTLGDEDYEDVTPIPDYDYNATFDYYTYNGTASINYDVYEVLHDTKNQGNTDSVPNKNFKDPELLMSAKRKNQNILLLLHTVTSILTFSLI